MLRRLLSTSLMIGAAAALLACGAHEDERSNLGARARNPPEGTIVIRSMFYSPPEVGIRTGDTVTWAWDDGRVEHDVVFDDGPASPRQTEGTWRRTFAKPGTYEYVCTLHPTMTGRIVVR